MLQRLSIRNLAIIDDLTLDFAEGFSALTGETGAGKSIIIGALNLVLGERASAEDVRTGAEAAEVEALFDLACAPAVRALLREFGVSAEDEETEDMVLRREVSAQGRSRCQANGRMLSVGQLREIGDLLVDIHGQHQHQALLRVETHREFLDACGGEPLAAAKTAYKQLYDEHERLTQRLRALTRDDREIERRKGVLDYQIDEIRKAALVPGEDAELETERLRLQHAEALGRGAGEIADLLLEGDVQSPTAADLLARCEELFAGVARLDPSMSETADRMAALRAEILDVADVVRSYAADVEHDPERLQEADDRLHAIKQLKRKYGETIEEILSAAEAFEAEREGLARSGEEREGLAAEIERTEAELARAAEALTLQRREAGERLARDLKRELKDLEMPNTRFEARLERESAVSGEPEGDVVEGRAARFPDGSTVRVFPWGAERVEFMISPNPGEELKPLRRIASGGELSRIMLALKSLRRMGEAQAPTLVFDEIDTGISGRTGARIGEKMTALGRDRQVLCITHLAQIAARADRHFAVRKTREKNRTLTRVEALADDARLDEIARLLGGQERSEAARIHARELLEESAKG